jgi:hypothetical protein
MKILLFTIVLALTLSACVNLGNQCVEDNVCSASEQIAGGCADCKPDFQVSELNLYFARDGVNEWIGLEEQNQYYLNGDVYTVSFISFSDDGTYTFTINGNPVYAQYNEPITLFDGTQFLITGVSVPAMPAPTPVPEKPTMQEVEVTEESVPVPITPSVVVEFTLTPRNAGGILYYNYCIKNTGGAFDGSVPVRTTLYQDLDTPISEEFQTQVTFQNQLVVGDFQLVHTGSGLNLQAQTHNDGGNEQLYCYGEARRVVAANRYNVNIIVNPDGAVTERDTSNNYRYGSVEGVPLRFPRYLLEYDMGPNRYIYSMSSTEWIPFASGGTKYMANYENFEQGIGLNVEVFAPNAPEESRAYFDGISGEIVMTGNGPVKLENNGPVDLETGSYDLISVSFLGRKNELIRTAVFIPRGSVLNPEQDPLISAYLRRFGTIALPKPECLIGAPYSCAVSGSYTSLFVQINRSVPGPANFSGLCGVPFYKGSWYQNGGEIPVSFDYVEQTVTFSFDNGIVNVAMRGSNGFFTGDLVRGGISTPISIDLHTQTLTIGNTETVLNGPRFVTASLPGDLGRKWGVTIPCASDALKCASVDYGDGGSMVYFQGMCVASARFTVNAVHGSATAVVSHMIAMS